MKTADIDKFWVLPFAGYIFNSPEECDGRIRHDLIKCVDVDELKDLIETKIKGWELRQERARKEVKKIEEEVTNFVLAELTELKAKL